MNLFFSYSRSQKKEVVDLVDFLSIYHKGWFDSKIEAGNEWWKEILSQIRNCDVFVFVLSDDSNQSKACLAELDYADRLGKHRVILQVDEIDPAFFPPALKGDNVTSYFSNDESRKNRLLRSLKEIEDKGLYVWDTKNYGDISEPTIPISELSLILTDIKSPEPLSVDEQEKLLNRIERLIAKKNEKLENIEKAIELFKKRDDVNYLVGKKMDGMLPLEKKEDPIPDPSNIEIKSFVLRDVVSGVERFTEDKEISSRLKNQYHNPSQVFGRWRRVKSIQNNQSLPVLLQEYIIFNNNYSFQLIQNNMQTNFGSFSFNQESLTIYFMNGMIDTRSFQCFRDELYIVQYMNNVAFTIDCYVRS